LKQLLRQLFFSHAAGALVILSLNARLVPVVAQLATDIRQDQLISSRSQWAISVRRAAKVASRLIMHPPSHY